MESSKKITFKGLKPNIVKAIKESCYRFDARLYNIANEVQNILTYSLESGVENTEGLLKIIDKTVKESVGVGCDLSVIAKGILVGTFRSCPSVFPEAQKTIHLLINELLQSVFTYKGDVKQTIEGLLTGIVIISNEYKFNVQEALMVAREEILSSAKALDPKFADDIKEVFPNLDDSL
jgi:hypothetical protein